MPTFNVSIFKPSSGFCSYVMLYQPKDNFKMKKCLSVQMALIVFYFKILVALSISKKIFYLAIVFYFAFLLFLGFFVLFFSSQKRFMYLLKIFQKIIYLMSTRVVEKKIIFYYKKLLLL